MLTHIRIFCRCRSGRSSSHKELYVQRFTQICQPQLVGKCKIISLSHQWLLEWARLDLFGWRGYQSGDSRCSPTSYLIISSVTHSYRAEAPEHNKLLYMRMCKSEILNEVRCRWPLVYLVAIRPISNINLRLGSSTFTNRLTLRKQKQKIKTEMSNYFVFLFHCINTNDKVFAAVVAFKIYSLFR